MNRNALFIVGFLLLVGIIIIAVTPTVASACPGCKEAVAANDPSQSGQVKGYFYSILFMMGTPFLVFGGFSAYMYHEVQKARAAKNEQQPPA
jgi:heme/copper-type cytochrome/quinol oxidase subunit 2